MTKAAFFDADQTLVYTPDSSGIQFMQFAMEKGIFKDESMAKIRDAQKRYKAQEINYEELNVIWGESFADGFKGRTQSEVSTAIDDFWEIIEPKFAAWTQPLLNLFHENGYETVLISGSPIELMQIFQRKFGFSRVFGSELEIKDGVYTGELLLNLVFDASKVKVVNKVVEEDAIDLEAAFGFGDNHHDRAFLDRVGYPIAINPNPELRDRAEEIGWPIFQRQNDVAHEIERRFFSISGN